MEPTDFEFEVTYVPTSVAQDERLSFGARGLYAFVISLATNFKITTQWLQEQGRDCDEVKLRRFMNELIKYGYLSKNDFN